MPLAVYARVYRDVWYGTITVRQEQDGLTISFDRSLGMSGRLEHVDHDTFRTHWRDPAIENAYITFNVGRDRIVTGAAMEPVSPLADFSFDFRDLMLRPSDMR